MPRILIAATLTLAPVAVSAQSQDEPRFFVRGGAFLADMRTSVRIDPNNRIPGSTLALEQDLRLDRRPAIPFIEAGWRFADSFGLSFEYFGIDRQSSAQISRTVVVGDTTYPVNAQLTGQFRSNLYKVQLNWYPYRSDSAEFALGLGAHLTDFLVALEGQGAAGGGATGLRREQRDVLAPLPNIGVSAHYRFGDGFAVQGEINWLQLKIDNYKGGLTDAEASLQYDLFNGIGIGAGWRLLNYRLDADARRFTGQFRYRFSGPVVFAIARF